MEGVVTLPSAAQAQALFAQFSRQWQQCNGMTTSEQSGPISTTNVISDVRATDTTVAATKTATAVLPNMPALRPTLRGVPSVSDRTAWSRSRWCSSAGDGPPTPARPTSTPARSTSRTR